MFSPPHFNHEPHWMLLGLCIKHNLSDFLFLLFSIVYFYAFHTHSFVFLHFHAVTTKECTSHPKSPPANEPFPSESESTHCSPPYVQPRYAVFAHLAVGYLTTTALPYVHFWQAYPHTQSTLVSALTAVFSDFLSKACRTCLSCILPLITFVLPYAAI